MKKPLFFLSFSFLIMIVLVFTYARNQIRKNRFETRAIKLSMEQRLNSDTKSLAFHVKDPFLQLPFSLSTVRFAEDDGIVLGVKTISIRNVVAPYNASLTARGDDLLLFFRYDQFSNDCPLPFKARIGCVKLDENLDQTDEEYKEIRLENEFNEDPRAFFINNELYLSYNSIRKNRPSNSSARIIKLAHLDASTLDVLEEVSLDIKRQNIEKNWTPFAVTNGLKEDLFFKYYLSKNQNLLLEDFKLAHLSEVIHAHPRFPTNGGWAIQWGELRGGTPALKISDEEYLSFFHSSFSCVDGTFWYIMGAYTFETKRPFRITKVSHYPLLFKGIFTAPLLNTANPNIRCVFPAGFVIKKRNGKDVIYLSIGENDSCVKILTLDKEALLGSLKKIHFD